METENNQKKFSRHADRIKIKLADESSLANLVSIQPIFHDDGVINESYLFFLYRKIIKGKFKYCCESRLRLGAENQIIHDNMIPYNKLNETIYKHIHDVARNFFLRGKVHRWLKKVDRIAREMNNIAYMMKCCNTAFRGGNVVISNKRTIEENLCTQRNFLGFDFVYTDDTVPDNMILQVATGDTNFDRPIIACPIINRKHFNEFCSARNCNIENIPVEIGRNFFPITQRFYNIYKVYEAYINENMPRWWYVEDLGGELTKNYFTTIRFLETKWFERRKKWFYFKWKYGEIKRKKTK